jgi:hypothetical protein
MKNIMRAYLSLPLGRKAALSIVLIFTTIIIFDSTILKFTSYMGFQFSTYSNILVFVAFLIVFSLISSFMISKVSQSDLRHFKKGWLKYFHIFIIISQIATFSIIVTIIFQMTFYAKYSIILLRLENFLAYVTSLTFIISLSLTFIKWFRSKRNYIAYLFLISFLLLGANVIVSLLYLEFYYSNPLSQEVRPYNLITFLTATRVLSFAQNLSLTFDILSTLSFVFMWAATIILLSQYHHTLGKAKYAILMCVPLLYYLLPLEAYFGSTFRSIILDSPYLSFYLVLFGATTQIGAFIFSLSFFVAAKLINNDRVRHYTLISFIGMAMVFGSLEIATLQYAVYPPFGLITQAFLPLGSYLLFIGIYSSASYVSQDRSLRREFYKTANSQLQLLREIGVTKMENDIMNRYKTLKKFYDQFGVKSDEERDEMRDVLDEVLKVMDKDEVREILHDVLSDVYSKRLVRRK